MARPCGQWFNQPYGSKYVCARAWSAKLSNFLPHKPLRYTHMSYGRRRNNYYDNPPLTVDMVNMWTEPQESSRRGNELIIVNQRPIKSYWKTPEFRLEVEAAIENR